MADNLKNGGRYYKITFDLIFELRLTAKEQKVLASPEPMNFFSPAGFSAACSSMLSEHAPTPPRFIGQRTCDVFDGV
jgi:hypothetical protein